MRRECQNEAEGVEMKGTYFIGVDDMCPDLGFVDGGLGLLYNVFSLVQFSSVQFSSVQFSSVESAPSFE